MADEHFLTAGDFSSGLGAVPFFGSGPYAPFPAGLDVAAAMAPFGMLPWAYELPLPTDSAATTTTAHFNSALSSLVSSPAHAGGDDVAIGDLIGRLGSICNTGASANNSRYSTPLSSPPGGASPAVTPAFRQGGYYYPGASPPLETGGGRLSRVASSKSLGGAAPALDSTAEAETSPTAAGKTETPAKGEGASGAARKRKASGKGKTAAATNGSPKRSKLAGDAGEEKKPEPVKDYIHVRARRGQATDGHSLAERVRREKISERMQLLQSLVPGCNKITGKALMLDGIINYVQSLQRQVEFLSMNLSTMNPQLDVDAPQYLPSDNDVMHHQQTAAAMVLGYPHQDAAAAFPYADPFAGAATRTTTTTDESCTGSSFHHPGAGEFGGWEAAAQDLRSIVYRHDVAPSSHDHHQQQQLPSSHPHDGLHGRQQEAATLSHMNVEP